LWFVVASIPSFIEKSTLLVEGSKGSGATTSYHLGLPHKPFAVAARVVGIGQKVNASYHRYGLKGKSELESMFFFKLPIAVIIGYYSGGFPRIFASTNSGEDQMLLFFVFSMVAKIQRCSKDETLF